jgi:hypothetical protein
MSSNERIKAAHPQCGNPIIFCWQSGNARHRSEQKLGISHSLLTRLDREVAGLITLDVFCVVVFISYFNLQSFRPHSGSASEV